ncbi:MAG: hypothetical protein J6033_03540 [Lachnospiraceae bacterium]|nr:hypothetical protein [Lachnospiraceae bacterium]
MAKEKSPEAQAAEAERKRLKEEKKQLKKQQADQKKEAKRRAKEIAKQEDEIDDDEEANGFVTFFATLGIVALWLLVICVIIKLDLGGFGTNVMTPLIGDIPVINRILPGNHITETTNPENYDGYTSLSDAVEKIRILELELSGAKDENTLLNEKIKTLTAEVNRLEEFEKTQDEFQRIRTKFYEEVVYSEVDPTGEEFQKYYESMDPTTAEYLYKQVIIKQQEDEEMKAYVSKYSSMKPKAAAAIFDEMTDNLNLVADILLHMNSESAGNILANMNTKTAAQVTKIMYPDS